MEPVSVVVFALIVYIAYLLKPLVLRVIGAFSNAVKKACRRASPNEPRGGAPPGSSSWASLSRIASWPGGAGEG